MSKLVDKDIKIVFYISYVQNARGKDAQPSALWQPRGVGYGGRGAGFRREGTYVYLWLTHVDVW